MEVRATRDDLGGGYVLHHQVVGYMLMPEDRMAILERVIEAAVELALCEHAGPPKSCLAQCTCGAWEKRNAARAEFFRCYRRMKETEQ